MLEIESKYIIQMVDGIHLNRNYMIYTLLRICDKIFELQR